MKTVSRAHSQRVAISDVETNARLPIDESDARSESALHSSALGPGNTTVIIACLHRCRQCQGHN